LIKVGFIGLGQMSKQHLVADWNLAFNGSSCCFVKYIGGRLLWLSGKIINGIDLREM
jgi:hypothetical protein